VISLRQNAERLRATGRVEEAEEFDRQAQVIDDKADKVSVCDLCAYCVRINTCVALTSNKDVCLCDAQCAECAHV
jgi:hypothetical protein